MGEEAPLKKKRTKKLSLLVEPTQAKQFESLDSDRL